MKLVKMYLKAFGPFTERVLDFGKSGCGLVLVYGPNEAGKSSALRAITDLRFGIPQQSRDDFVHAHPDMRIGGDFLDRNGKLHSLMRRKGRGSTLLLVDFEQSDIAAGDPAPPELESLLTGGLRREEYETMFGLDHERLRQGGMALLKGQGDVGAALFEASAGVRSIPDVLDRIDGQARTFFMPGARGKNARINEALRTFDERSAEFKQSQVRPAQWAELFRKHQAAKQELAELEERSIKVIGKLSLIQELRAVAPMISHLDSATRVIEELKGTSLLSETAATERAAAESGLTDALHNAKEAADELALQSQRLQELTPDIAILAVELAIRRLSSSSEAIDQHRRDIADAAADVSADGNQVIQLAAKIDASLSPEEVIAKAPTKARIAEVESQLRAVEQAERSLTEHRSLGRQEEDSEGSGVPELPSAESLTALRIVQTEITRSNSALKRLASLPAEIKAANRLVKSALDRLGLADEAFIEKIRPLLDAQIDAAMKEENEGATRRADLEKRIGEISRALPMGIDRRDKLMEQGAVATRDDVDSARAYRDKGWGLVRATYIEQSAPPTDAFAGGRPLVQAYEEAVSRADRLIDDLASDTDRAAQLQASKREIETLVRDREELERQVGALDSDDAARQKRWGDALAEAQLPSLSPAALRDWQGLLPAMHAAREQQQEKLDELEAVQATESALGVKLRAAIMGTGMAAPGADAQLSTLSAMGSEIEGTIKVREAAISEAAGKEVERKRQSQLRSAREKELVEALRVASEAVKPALARLLLPEEVNVAVTRARLLEFQDLLETERLVAAARAKKERAEQALSVLKDSVDSVAASLGATTPSDLRLYIDQLVARLDAAEAIDSERRFAQQALDVARESQKKHNETLARHESTLERLCLAAGVSSSESLPEAEVTSRRKRAAQDDIDRSRLQLASASRRPLDELRALLAEINAAQMDADEASSIQEQGRIDGQLPEAREREELSRHELEAIDGSDSAAVAREAMERAAASVRANMPSWIRAKVAHGLLAEALMRFRDRAQGPMLIAASGYFERMTQGAFIRLLSDDSGKEPALLAVRDNQSRVRVEDMSEGTRDQLYLALRLAAIGIRRTGGVDLPLILDDVLITSDEDRSGAMLDALADFARNNQAVVFTHHRHIADLAGKRLPADALTQVTL